MSEAGSEPEPGLAQRHLEYRRVVQSLITASFHDDYHFPRLVDEALDEVGPEAITATLMGYIMAYTSHAHRPVGSGRDMVDYVVRSTCRAFDDLAHERGRDPHEFIQSQLAATNPTFDDYHCVAQQLLATAFLPVAHASLYNQTLDIAAPAYRRVGNAILDLWFNTALDALPTSEWCVVKPLLECCVELILTHSQLEACTPEEFMQSSWLISESIRV